MSTSTLLETIKIKNGKIAHLSYHQKRSALSQKALYGIDQPLELATIIHPPKTGRWKIKTLKMVTSSISCTFKYADRSALNDLLTSNENYDEVLIIKNGYITDTTISNIALFEDGVWYTPTDPLLKGTVRQRLLDEGFLHTRAIKSEQIANYTQVALMNAMLGFKVLNDLQIVDLEGKTHDYESFTDS